MAKEPEFVIIEDMPGLVPFLKARGYAIEVFNFKEHKASKPQKRIKIYLGNISQAFRAGWGFGMWYQEQIRKSRLN